MMWNQCERHAHHSLTRATVVKIVDDFPQGSTKFNVITTLASRFSCVMGLTLDNATNVYVSDAGAGMIFKVSPSGTVSSIAGAERTRGYGGDGGLATDAQFNVNYGIAFDNRSGILYVADHYNHRVRSIYPTGIIQTVTGTGVLDSAATEV
jgi:sugar lactone lactonase YvrE